MKLSNFTRRAVMATAATAAFALPAQADVDMSGKTIEWTIPFSETGARPNGQISLPHFCPKHCLATPLLWLNSCLARALRKVPTGFKSKQMATAL